jgi:transketolase
MRDAVAQALYELSKEDDRIFFVVADISPASSLDDFLRQNPTRFIDVGVAEQNLVGVSAGLAIAGYRPFAYTIANFTIFRPFEQIRIDLCYQNLPVVLVGVGAGLSYSALGSTHHTQEDIAVMAALPNMTIVAPCDPLEVKAAIRQSLMLDGPMYLRIGKAGEPDLSADALEPFEIGKIRQLLAGQKTAILSYGPIMSLVVEAAIDANNECPGAVAVFCAHTLKPLDTDRIVTILKEFDTIITVEEHVASGSLGSSVIEIAYEHGLRTRIHRLHLLDDYLHTYGSQNDLRAISGISLDNLALLIRESL